MARFLNTQSFISSLWHASLRNKEVHSMWENFKRKVCIIKLEKSVSTVLHGRMRYCTESFIRGHQNVFFCVISCGFGVTATAYGAEQSQTLFVEMCANRRIGPKSSAVCKLLLGPQQYTDTWNYLTNKYFAMLISANSSGRKN